MFSSYLVSKFKREGWYTTLRVISITGWKGGVQKTVTSVHLAMFLSDKGKVDGIHDIHMNQGNPKGNHGGDNGVWQDGALLIHLPSKETWTAVFIAFQTESWSTDSAGNPEKA